MPNLCVCVWFIQAAAQHRMRRLVPASRVSCALCMTLHVSHHSWLHAALCLQRALAAMKNARVSLLSCPMCRLLMLNPERCRRWQRITS